MQPRLGGERVGALLLACGLLACSSGSDQIAVDSTHGAPPAVTASSPFEDAARARGLTPLSVDERGLPRLVRAVRPLPSHLATPEAAARRHLVALAPVWGVDVSAPSDVIVEAVHPLRGGATVVALRQQVGGIEIYGGQLRVLLDRDRALHAIAGTRETAVGAARPGAFRIGAAEALATSARDRFGVTAAGPSQQRRVLYRVGDELRAAWAVELYGASGNSAQAWRVIVDAETGAVLERVDLTADAVFSYRVFADATAEGRPFDGPQQSFEPHPSGTPDGSQPAFVAPNLVSIDGFNGPGDPWLASGATVSRGNNVDAYVDLSDGQDGFTAGTDFRADTTSAGAFDYTYDTASGPLANQTQQKAAIVHLFYVINWLHDWFYDSGFTEAAGNAQADNYGRGGVGGDALLAEAQDNAIGGQGTQPSRNNANMSTPSDGMPPKMQMFLWSGLSEHTLTAEPGNLSFANGTAAFGPQEFDVTGTLVLASDGTAPTSDACSAIGNISGQIALVDRGTCTFDTKATNVKNAGGIGMIVANNTAGTVEMAGNGATLPPSLSVSQADGDALKTMLGNGTVTVHMVRTAAGPERDGDLDTAIVAHEWGHYFHHRLSSCGTAQCGAMSEGWADFISLLTMLRPTDDPHRTYSVGLYAGAVFGDPYFGIRRAPYSTDFTKNGFTFAHIQASAALPTTFPIAFSGNNNEVHNAGEVWAAMLWEAYVGLIDARGYATARRAFSDYIVAGLLMTPVDATFTETRDAILAATAAISTADAVVVAEAFARRGAGSCAVSPPRSSTTFDGVVESFTVSGELGVGAVTLVDDLDSCDDDGILDAGETATLRVEVINGGAGPLTATTIDVTTTTPGVTVVNGSASVPTIAPFSSTVVAIPVQLDASVAARTTVELSIALDDAAACNGGFVASARFAAHYDVVPASSTVDDVEAPQTLWSLTGADAAEVWSRQPVTGQTTVWHGNDTGAVTDTQLVSPALPVGTGAFSVTFTHRYSFEYSPGPPTYWDGGVVELSTDGGATWADVTTFGAAPGYNGTLSTAAGNPLGGRQAYARRNAAYPNRNTVTLSFGTQFAGQTVRLRFRIGTDEAAGDYGWDVDDLTFTGITSTPFPSLADETDSCTPVPPPDAMPIDAMPIDAPPVVIDAAPIDAPPVVIDAMPIDAMPIDAMPIDAMPIDAAPPSPDAAPADATPPSPDAAPATVDADPPIDAPGDGGGGSDGGCGCQSSGGSPAGALAPLAALALALRRRRRTRAVSR